MAVWNPEQELRKLEEKVANSKEEKICTSDLLIPSTAVREAGWDQALVEEAIERGLKRREGEVLEAPSWEELEEAMPESPQVLGIEAAETEQEAPTRLPGVLERIPVLESKELKELREKGFDLPKDELWDCPRCTLVNHLMEEECPNCKFSLRAALQLELEWKQLKERVMKEHGLPLDTVQVEETLLEMSEAKTNMEKIVLERPEASTADIEAAFQEKAAEVEDADSRKRVLVSEEVGWLCEDCNRVWPIEYAKCLVCHPEEAEKYNIPVTPPTVEHRSWDDILKAQAEKKAEEIDPESTPDKEPSFAEKAALMLLAKSKEKKSE